MRKIVVRKYLLHNWSAIRLQNFKSRGREVWFLSTLYSDLRMWIQIFKKNRGKILAQLSIGAQLIRVISNRADFLWRNHSLYPWSEVRTIENNYTSIHSDRTPLNSLRNRWSSRISNLFTLPCKIVTQEIKRAHTYWLFSLAQIDLEKETRINWITKIEIQKTVRINSKKHENAQKLKNWFTNLQYE